MLFLPHCPADAILQLERRVGVPLGTGCSEEVNTGYPVRFFALIQAELPDHKGYQVGVGGSSPGDLQHTGTTLPQARLALR